jgi:hypothetical protein
VVVLLAGDRDRDGGFEHDEADGGILDHELLRPESAE